MEWLNQIEVSRGIAPWVIPAIVAIAGSVMNRGSGQPGTSTQQMTPEMRTMFNMELQKQRAQMPLYNNVLMMANRMLPMWARQQGVGGMTENRQQGDPGTDMRDPTSSAIPTGRKAVPRF
jgi:hypothetical protein